MIIDDYYDGSVLLFISKIDIYLQYLINKETILSIR